MLLSAVSFIIRIVSGVSFLCVKLYDIYVFMVIVLVIIVHTYIEWTNIKSPSLELGMIPNSLFFSLKILRTKGQISETIMYYILHNGLYDMSCGFSFSLDMSYD